MIENEAKLSIASVNIRHTASGRAGPSCSLRGKSDPPGPVERVFEIG